MWRQWRRGGRGNSYTEQNKDQKTAAGVVDNVEKSIGRGRYTIYTLELMRSRCASECGNQVTGKGGKIRGNLVDRWRMGRTGDIKCSLWRFWPLAAVCNCFSMSWPPFCSSCAHVGDAIHREEEDCKIVNMHVNSGFKITNVNVLWGRKCIRHVR